MYNLKRNLLVFIAVAFAALGIAGGNLRAGEPWTVKQLMPPAELNKILKGKNASKVYIYSIGYQAVIKGSIDIGPGRDVENQKKLKKMLAKVPKDAQIVIYCGCCPFDRCPNIRPIFDMLNQMGFKNHKLLDIPNNIKVDWIDKGYEIKK